MPTRKVADVEGMGCRHPEHEPASMKVWEPGVYEHECPACGEPSGFTVEGIYV